jgi:hypothetical protein
LSTKYFFCQKFIKNLSKSVKKLSKKKCQQFVTSLSIICPFAQIVPGRRRKRRRLVAPRPSGDFIAPGNKTKILKLVGREERGEEEGGEEEGGEEERDL